MIIVDIVVHVVADTIWPVTPVVVIDIVAGIIHPVIDAVAAVIVVQVIAAVIDRVIRAIATMIIIDIVGAVVVAAAAVLEERRRPSDRPARWRRWHHSPNAIAPHAVTIANAHIRATPTVPTRINRSYASLSACRHTRSSLRDGFGFIARFDNVVPQ